MPLGVGPEPGRLARVAAGLLWIAALLACLLSLDRLFQADHEDGTLDVLALAPLPLAALVALKALAHWLTTGLPLVVAAPLLAVTLNLPAPAYPWLVASLAVGTPGLSFLGAIGAALTRRASGAAGCCSRSWCCRSTSRRLIFGARAPPPRPRAPTPCRRLLLLAGLEPRHPGARPLHGGGGAADQPALTDPRGTLLMLNSMLSASLRGRVK